MVSVVIPTCNSAQFLAAATESVLAQTYRDIEVIVVNDGSTDNTDDVVRPYLDRIHYIKQCNKGLSAARNAGFKASSGQFVCFLDADDVLMPDKFERQIAKFNEQPDLGVVISGYLDVESDGTTIINTVRKPWNRDGLTRLLNHEVFPPHAALVRREVLERSSLFPENIDTAESQEDWQLWLDLALDGVQFGSVVEPTCLYRRNVNGSISSNLLKHNDGARRVVQWLRSEPRAQKYRTQVERLAAIVEMERVGRAWRIGEKEIALATLVQSADEHGDFWSETQTFRRLFEHTLTLHQSVAWSKSPDVGAMEQTLIDGILDAARGRLSESQRRKLLSAALLCLADTAYGLGDGRRARAYVRRALSERKGLLLASENFPTLARSVVGPAVGGVVGRALRVVQGKV